MRSPVLPAILSLMLCAAYIGMNVAWIYGGNVTGLFYTGTDTPLPTELEAEPTWRVRDPIGYDAQFYHLALHDPLLQRGFHTYADNAPLRFRRIGVPGLAAGIHAVTRLDPHWAYVFLQLLFVFLGARWLSRYAASIGLPAIAGLGLLVIPAVLVSVDRMTVDLPLAALCIGFLWNGTQKTDTRRWPLYAILCFAPLVRETGLLLVAGWVIWNSIQKHWKTAIAGACCAAPAIGWWIFVYSRVGSDGTPWLARYPFSGIVDRIIAGDPTPTSTSWLKAAWATEHLAFAGICLAMGCCIALVWKKGFGLTKITAIVFMVFAAFLGKADIWNSAYATGRTMSPMLILLALMGLRDRRYLYLLPTLLILPRIALQYQAQITASIRALP